MDEQRIREIVREELAAQKEQPEVISLSPEKREFIDDYIKFLPADSFCLDEGMDKAIKCRTRGVWTNYVNRELVIVIISACSVALSLAVLLLEH